MNYTFIKQCPEATFLDTWFDDKNIKGYMPYHFCHHSNHSMLRFSLQMLRKIIYSRIALSRFIVSDSQIPIYLSKLLYGLLHRCQIFIVISIDFRSGLETKIASQLHGGNVNWKL